MAPILSRVVQSFGVGSSLERKRRSGGGPELKISGGNLYYEDATYSWFVFTSPGTLTVAKNDVGSDALVLLGGGGGGGGAGGDGRNATGGGGGGLVFFGIPSPVFANAKNYQVARGIGGEGTGGRGSNSVSGGPSTFQAPGYYTLTGQGGGRGADWDRGPQADPGGSGGGYDTSGYSPYTAGTGTQPSANSGIPWVRYQWGSPGGGGLGGSPGFAGVGVPAGASGDWEPTTRPLMSPFYPSIGGDGNDKYCGRSNYSAPGGGGICIVRTKKRTGPA